MRVTIQAKAKRPIRTGEVVLESEIEEIRGMRLDDEERDFAHVTVIRHGNGWAISFNFLYDASKAKQFLGIGDQFMASARADLDDGRMRPLINSLMITAENYAKARIWLMPDKKGRGAKQHRDILDRVKVHSTNSSVISLQFHETLERLTKERDKARYTHRYDIPSNQAAELLKIISDLGNEVRQLVASVSDR